MLDLKEPFVSKRKNLVGVDNTTNNYGNNNFGAPCHNSPKHLAHLSRTQRNVRQNEMKMSLLQILMLILLQVLTKTK